ncbi:hypothetical protein ACFOG5_14935 [Pedobacter fastidiosus]
MEILKGGKLCSGPGYTTAGLIGGAIGGPILAAVFYISAWGGCSLN